MSQGQYDRHLTIFSPDGKLYQIEYAIKAVSQCGLTGVCLRGKDSVCMVVQRKVPDKLMDPAYMTSMYRVTPAIGCLAVGMVPDCKTVVMRARQIAAKFKDKNGYEIPVHFLAQKMGKQGQIFTQHAGARPFACTVNLCAIDDEKGPQLWKVDPSGHYFGWKASSVGSKEQEASNFLEKVVRRNNAQGSMEETVEKTIDCLQVVLSQDLKAADIEVAVATKDEFRFLSTAEIDGHLTSIAEKD